MTQQTLVKFTAHFVFVISFLFVAANCVVSENTRLQDGKPKTASWFANFDQRESTYDADADGTIPWDPRTKYTDGWEPTVANPYEMNAVNTDFFHESPSGNYHQAWQTHYPAIQTGLAGRGVDLGKWHQNAGGSWSQSYQPGETRSSAGSMSAEWFDANVNQWDTFGRPIEPRFDFGRRWATRVGWVERAVNTSLTCAEIGCQAQATMNLFDPTIERARFCKFKLYIHPTDYDNAYSEEYVDFVSINGVNVRTNCAIKRDGCNFTHAAPLYPCTNEIPLDLILNSTGSIEVSAKINKYVDECPFEGQLLHAVPLVTCMVGPQQPAPLYGGVSNYDTGTGGIGSGTVSTSSGATWVAVEGPLRCKEQGCNTSVALSLTHSESVDQCLMSVIYNQTDFDNELNQGENITFLAIGDRIIARDMTPGYNPCMWAWQDNPKLAEEDMIFTAVSDFDVTDWVKNGTVLISSGISEFVDECPAPSSDGWLLHATVTINCTLALQTTTATMTPTTATTTTSTTTTATVKTTTSSGVALLSASSHLRKRRGGVALQRDPVF